ncbi:F-box-like domain protein, putative, partial [Rhizoctonia solani AG-3 Rhs1AP]
MAEELDLATTYLNDALNRYNILCTGLRNHYVSGTGLRMDNTPELTGRVVQELSRASSYETEIRHSKAILNQLYNISGSRPAVSINKLPLEILARIFEDVVNTHPCPVLEDRLRVPSKATFLKDPVILSHVCSHWRRVAINTATLWSHIDIDPSLISLSETSARLDFYKARSADALLDIHVAEAPRTPDAPYYPPSSADPAMIDLLALTSPRMRSLTLTVSASRKMYRTFLATCFSNCTPGTLASVSIRSVGRERSDWPHLVEARDLQHMMDKMTGLPFDTAEAIWHGVKILQLGGFRPTWSSKAFHGLIELRLVKVGRIRQSRLGSILHSSPQLRVLELDIEFQSHIPGDPPITAVRLDNLEILILGGVKQEQLGLILPLIDPGSKPLSLSLVNPYMGSREFTSKNELARFAARSCITRFIMHEFDDYSQLAEMFSLMPNLQVVAVNALNSGEIDQGAIFLEFNIQVFYVLNSCSLFSRFTWPQLQNFVEKHRVQKLVLWQYDFRYCGLSELGREAIPDNLYTICPVVHLVPDTDPNPILEWFGE